MAYYDLFYNSCSNCLFNNEKDNNCKRNLYWEWKGDYFPLSRSEYDRIKLQVEYENLKLSIFLIKLISS